MKVLEYLKLIRVRQWYKNLIIFLPLFFVGDIFDAKLLLLILYGFIALCAVSSANYIINDIIDINVDKLHPDKKKRPLASGNVSILEAVILIVISLAIAWLISSKLGVLFKACLVLLFVITTAYSIWLKKEPILDIIIIAGNFVIRAIAGAFVISFIVSPWLILCPFFLALFLAVAKRDADIRLLKSNALKHKEVLKFYTKPIIESLMIVTATCLIIAYSLYAFSKTSLMLLTMPFALYVVFRYYSLAQQGSEIARNPEKIYKDLRMVIAILLWGITVFIVYYFLAGRLPYPL